MWSPPDADEPTSELYRLTTRRRSQLREALDAAHGAGQLREAIDAATGTGGTEDDGPLPRHAVPHRLRWRELAARAKLVWRRAAGWAWELATAALAVVIGSLDLRLIVQPLGRPTAPQAGPRPRQRPMSHPPASSPAAWPKASHAAESAAATSTASTATMMVTLTKSWPRRVSDSISAPTTAGLSGAASREVAVGLRSRLHRRHSRRAGRGPDMSVRGSPNETPVPAAPRERDLRGRRLI